MEEQEHQESEPKEITTLNDVIKDLAEIRRNLSITSMVLQILAMSQLLLENVLLSERPEMQQEYHARLKELHNVSMSASLSPQLFPDIGDTLTQIVNRPFITRRKEEQDDGGQD